MIIYPPIVELVEKAGSRYTLVLEAAKRARQLSQGAEALTQAKSNKEVTLATNEIYEDKLCVISTYQEEEPVEAPAEEA